MENQFRQASRTRRLSLFRASIAGSEQQGSVRASRFLESSLSEIETTMGCPATGAVDPT